MDEEREKEVVGFRLQGDRQVQGVAQEFIRADASTRREGRGVDECEALQAQEESLECIASREGGCFVQESFDDGLYVRKARMRLLGECLLEDFGECLFEMLATEERSSEALHEQRD